ncbi:Galactose binding lectin domain family protein [Brugia pahangi]
MFIVLLAITMNCLGWFSTTTTTATATSSHTNSEIINALMMESLKSNLVQACDNERIILHCPKNTQILLENIFYGRLVPSNQLCPSLTAKQQFALDESISCDVVDAHAKIMEQCRNKRKCKIMIKPSFFGIDPCPNTSKYLQISYKCKPVSFDEEIFCEGSTMQLSCKQNKRLVIYSAQYGRKVEERTMHHCSPNTPISQDCVIDVLSQLFYDCHAQTECTVTVNDEHLNKVGCALGIQKYLKLIFMCMNDEIFTEAAIKGNLETMKKIISDLSPRKLQKAETVLVKDNERTFHIKDDPNLGYRPIQKNKNVNVILSSLSANSYEELDEESAFVAVTSTSTDLTSSNNAYHFNAFGFIHDCMLIVRAIKDNKEKVLLCLLLSFLIGLLMLLIACTVSGCYRRKMKRKNSRRKNNEEIMQTTKPTELSTLMRNNNHTASVFLNPSSRIYFDVGNLSNNKESLLRFTQLTQPRVPQIIHGYS